MRSVSSKTMLAEAAYRAQLVKAKFVLLSIRTESETIRNKDLYLYFAMDLSFLNHLFNHFTVGYEP